MQSRTVSIRCGFLFCFCRRTRTAKRMEASSAEVIRHLQSEVCVKGRPLKSHRSLFLNIFHSFHELLKSGRWKWSFLHFASYYLFSDEGQRWLFLPNGKLSIEFIWFIQLEMIQFNFHPPSQQFCNRLVLQSQTDQLSIEFAVQLKVTSEIDWVIEKSCKFV